jgi:hypothetical protein
MLTLRRLGNLLANVAYIARADIYHRMVAIFPDSIRQIQTQ